MPNVDITLRLSAAECLAHYRGGVDNVYARSLDGRRVLFPAKALRQVVTRDGVDGVFRLTFSDDGRFEGIEPLGKR